MMMTGVIDIGLPSVTVRRVLYRTASVESADKRQQQRRFVRLLHEAITQDDMNAVRQLLSTVDKELSQYEDPGLNHRFRGSTALQLAITHGGQNSTEICRCLVRAGADVDLIDPTSNDAPLHLATRLGQGDIVNILIEAGADLQISDASGATPLGVAASTGVVSIAEALIRAGCDLNRGDTSQVSPLICSTYHGHIDIVKYILADKTANLNWTDNERRTALIVAAQQGREEIAQVLVNAGSDINASDQYGGTALYFAAKFGHTGIVQLLIGAGADLNKSDTKGCTPFTVAVESLQMEIVKLLIDACCDVNTADVDNKSTAIHNAVRFSSKLFGQRDLHLALVKLLLDTNCDVNVSDKHGWTPLYQAAYGGETDIVRLLLAKGADVTKVTHTLDTPLHGSILGNQPEITDMLIKAGCEVNKVNIRNKLPLYMAIESRADNEIVRLLLEAGSKTDICEIKSHQSPLYVAVQQQYVDAVELLIKAGCNVNLPNSEGDTPLWLACSLGNDKIVDILLRHPNVDVNKGVSRCPLHAAAVFGSYTIIEKLIKAGCNINKLSNIGVCALFLAAEMNHFSVAQLLVRHGASPSAAHHLRVPSLCCRAYKDTHPHLELEPLFAAVQNDNLAMIRLILVATPRMPYHALVDLRDIVFRTHYVQDAQLSERTVKQFAHFFVGVLSRPRSLRDECRGIIRGAVTFGHHAGTLAEAVALLPLPERLKDDIMLRDEPVVGFNGTYL